MQWILDAEAKANGVAAVAIVGCRASEAVAAKFQQAHIAHQCVDALDIAQSFILDHGTAPAAVVRVKVKGRPEGVAPELLVGHVQGGLSAPVTVEVLVAGDEGRSPVRAVLAHPPSWTRSAGTRELWFVETSAFLDTFNKIYRERVWSNAGGGSGTGSSLQAAAAVQEALPKLIKKYDINSMLDSSCGSMHWMPRVLEQVKKDKPHFKFYGSDVVCDLTAQHTANFTMKGHRNWRFGCHDYANQPLPKGYDLVWSRDSLQHVTLKAAFQFLNNVRATRAKYLLVGSYLDKKINLNITAGEYYPLNLLEPPFNLRPKPLQIIDEHSEVVESPKAHKKFMLLFDMAQLEWDDDLAWVE